MNEFIINQKSTDGTCYDLFGVVLHVCTINGGHYTAIAKNKNDWFEFNDRQVTKI